MNPGTTLGVVLPLAGGSIDLDPTYGANEIQTWIAALIAIAAITVSALFIRYQSSRILDGEEAEHAREVTSGLRTRDRTVIRIPASDDPGSYREQLRAAFQGEHDVDVPSVRGAIGEVAGEWRRRRRAATRSIRDEVPALARLLSLDAVVYLILGALALESVATWGRVFTAGARPPAPGVVLDRTVGMLTQGATTAVDVAGSFPYAGLLWELSFIAVIETGTFLYERVYLVAAVLLTGAVVVWIGDRLVADDVDRRLYRTRPRAVVGVVAVVVVTWLAGVATASLLRGLHSTVGPHVTAGLVGAIVFPITWRVAVRRLERYDVDGASGLAGVVAAFAVFVAAAPVYLVSGPTWGGGMGLLASFAAASVVVRRELAGVYGRLTAAYEQADDQGVGKTATILYVGSRKVFGAFGVAAALVVPMYVVKAVESGKVLAIAEIATRESSVQVQATIAFVAVALLAFAVVQTRPAWGDLFDALGYAFDRQGLRVALLSRGLPLLAIVLAFFMFLGSGFLGTRRALVAAVATGVAVRGFLWLVARADDAYYRFDDEPPKPGRVFVECVVVDDARDQSIAYAELNGSHDVAAPVESVATPGDAPRGGIDELVEQVVRDVESIFQGREPADGGPVVFTGEPSVFEYYADRIRDGRTGFDDVVAEYRGHIDHAIDVTLENAGRGGLDEERLDALLTDEYDETMYESKKLEKRRKPNGIVVVDGVVRRS